MFKISSIVVSISLLFGMSGLPNASAVHQLEQDEPIWEDGFENAIEPTYTCTPYTFLLFRGAEGSVSSGSIPQSPNRAELDYNSNPSEDSEDDMVGHPRPDGSFITTNGWEGATLSLMVKRIAASGSDMSRQTFIGIGPDRGYKAEIVNLLSPAQDIHRLTESYVGDTVAFMNTYKAGCPNTRFILMGYSMGAVMVHIIMRASPGYVVGTYLLGDPSQRTNPINSFRGFADPRISNNTYSGTSSDFINRYLCHSDDAVCEWKPEYSLFNLAPNPQHKNYFESQSELSSQLMPFSMDYQLKLYGRTAPLNDFNSGGIWITDPEGFPASIGYRQNRYDEYVISYKLQKCYGSSNSTVCRTTPVTLVPTTIGTGLEYEFTADTDVTNENSIMVGTSKMYPGFLLTVQTNKQTFAKFFFRNHNELSTL